MSNPLIIDYYTDVLCVWAWIAQRRLEELQENWGDQIELRHHYLNLFGDTANRIGKGWASKGGFKGFGEHVREAAAPFETANIYPNVWSEVRPTTSATAHLTIKAAELICDVDKAGAFAFALRREFFEQGRDISSLPVILDVATRECIDAGHLSDVIDDGTAMAALMTDYKNAQDLDVKGSPTWIMNGGRQVLYGNIGYRVLNANIEEILKRPLEEASWC